MLLLTTDFIHSDIFPVVVFLGLFILIYIIGMPMAKHLPRSRKHDGMWSEVLRDIPAHQDETQTQDDEGEDIILNVSTDDIKRKEGSAE